MTTELIIIEDDVIKKACDFISGDLNIYLTFDQMVNLLSKDIDILNHISDFGIDDSAVKEELHNHFCISLIGRPSPFQSDEDWANIPEADIESFVLQLQNAACEKGYRYSTHPDGPEADLV